MCHFFGYGINQKGYHWYDPVTKKLYISRHATFFERLPYVSLPLKEVPTAKEDLIHIDPFPIDVLAEEFISTLAMYDISAPRVLATPTPPPWKHVSIFPMTYSRRSAAPQPPVSNSPSPQSYLTSPDLPTH